MKVKLFDGFNNVVLRTGDDPTGIGRLVVVWASSGWGRWWRRWRCSDVGQFIGCWRRGRGYLNVWATSMEFGEEGEDV